MWKYQNTDYTNDYLAHYGILGMKWGIRRYQNPDGSLTAEGKARYSDDYVTSRKDPKSLTNNELSIAANRYGLEDRYNTNKANASPLNKTAKNVAVGAAAVATLAAAGYAGYKIYSIIKGKNDPLTKEIKDQTAQFKDHLVNTEEGRNTVRSWVEKGMQSSVIKSVANNKTKVSQIIDTLKVIHSDDDSNFLAHHGVKGQKWGIRRYQNPDGSLTAEGRKRYGVDSYDQLSPAQKKELKRMNREEYKLQSKQLKNEAKEEQHQSEIVKKQLDNEHNQKMATRMNVGLAAAAVVLGLTIAGVGMYAKHKTGQAASLVTDVPKTEFFENGKAIVYETVQNSDGVFETVVSGLPSLIRK